MLNKSVDHFESEDNKKLKESYNYDNLLWYLNSILAVNWRNTQNYDSLE